MSTTAPKAGYFRKMPKAELHLHLEGSLRPELLRQLAIKNSVSLPPCPPGEEEPAYRYGTFLEFLDCFKTACSVLCSPEDLATAAEDLFDTLIAERIRYAEIMLSPVIHERRGVSTRETMLRIHEIAEHKRELCGFRCQFLFDAVRQWGVESFGLNCRLAEACMDLGVVGIGVGGDESALPAAALAPAYRLAQSAGLHLTAHAGEYGGASSVLDVLHYLQPERIGHGIRVADDLAAMEEIRRAGTVLDISLTSNLRTAVWPRLEDHPVKKISQAGIRFSLNSDDPALFGTSLSLELEKGSALLGWGVIEIQELMLSTISSSFLPESEKALLASRFRCEFAEICETGGATLA